jgi:hypothetical protein
MKSYETLDKQLKKESDFATNMENFDSGLLLVRDCNR